MTTYLFSTILTAGAERMFNIDPHGWTLTGISITVVFTALVILYFLYNFSGNLFSGKFKAKNKVVRSKGKNQDNEIAAAIAMALEAECSDTVPAAIATALHLYLSQSVHDVEPGIITIRRTASGWNAHNRNFRKNR